MAKQSKKTLSKSEQETLLETLQVRFEKNKNRHKNIEWSTVLTRLKSNNDKLWSLHQMEISGGEPDVVDLDKKTGEIIFYDCSVESPAERRSLCFDKESLDSRKENKPSGNVEEMANEMGIELLNEDQYRYLQQLGKFDLKTSSWIVTPAPIRKLGGALFGDRRYDHVFVYHNGASSYYAARGFRGMLKI
jgi:Protein of unknown function (DUF4256)